MELPHVVERVQTLSDLELAMLLCLIAKQHCIITTDEEQIDAVTEELVLISSNVFDLSYAVLACDEYMTTEGFGEAVLDQETDHSAGGSESGSGHDRAVGLPALCNQQTRKALSSAEKNTHHPLLDVGDRAGSISRTPEPHLDNRKVVNVVIAKNFNMASEEVQIQGLELIRRRRLFSRTTVHPAPETCLLIPLIAVESKSPLNPHLNDRIFISHYHDPEDGFPNLEDLETGYVSDDQASTSSIVRESPRSQHGGACGFDQGMIGELRRQSEMIAMTPEVRSYLQNIVVFLRLERGVIGGISPYATALFESLAKYLALLHGLNYVIPSMVALAARKIYLHRIMIAAPEKERSMQYGSDLEAVKELLNGVTSETVIEAVLNSVECPL